MDYTYLNYTNKGENSISFKKLVLEKAKQTNLFMHLRDSPVKDYTFEEWVKRLYGQDYYIKEIEQVTERIKEYQEQLLDFETDEGVYNAHMKQLEWHLCGKYESMLKGIQNKTSYSFQKVKTLNQRKENLENVLKEWEQFSTDDEYAQHIIQDLQDKIREMIKTIEHEMNTEDVDVEHTAQSYMRYIEQYKSMSIKEKEKVIREELQDNIKHWTEKLKTYKKCLKRLEVEDEAIRILFESLDKIDREV